jgi:nickel-dependent lactate racemase
MANYTKNIFIGTGGSEGINKSHFLGAVFGMERMMGRADTPVRKVLNYAAEHFASHLPIAYLLTVVGSDDNGQLKIRGLFAGDDHECFELACKLSLKVNFRMLDEPVKKVVVYLDPAEYKSTWLGNKSIYRTRMAIADGGELIILAPGVATFGEDRIIDTLIRKYGYITAKEVIRKVAENDDLKSNLSAAAHLIHGSSENRFSITYCTGKLSEQEITGVGFHYAGLEKMIRRYDPSRLREGMNKTPDGEDVFFIPNPALGLWACRGRY